MRTGRLRFANELSVNHTCVAKDPSHATESVCPTLGTLLRRKHGDGGGCTKKDCTMCRAIAARVRGNMLKVIELKGGNFYEE